MKHRLGWFRFWERRASSFASDDGVDTADDAIASFASPMTAAVTKSDGVAPIAVPSATASTDTTPLQDQQQDQPAPLNVAEQRARAAAVRAFAQARDHRYNHARALFAEAAILDPALDLSTVPSFWSLSRAGQRAAVEAYELAGRGRDAAVLNQAIRYTFRPKLVRGRGVQSVPSGR